MANNLQTCSAPSGLLIVDKPAGMTSHDVVARIRRLAHTRRVGHGGTLDPMATGVLVVGIGAATKLLTFLSGSGKEYEATMRLGISTSSEDKDGEITASNGCPRVDMDTLIETCTQVQGRGWQVPSSVSAIKINGKRAHALMREGKEVLIPPRPVTISRLDVKTSPRFYSQTINSADIPVTDVDLDVACSSGTYVRAIARDIGDQLETGAHLTALRRNKVSVFTIDNAHTLDALTDIVENGSGDLPIIPLAHAVRRLFPHIVVTAEEAERFGHGQSPERTRQYIDSLFDGSFPRSSRDGPIGVFTEHHNEYDGTSDNERPSKTQGQCLGLVQYEEGKLRTMRVWNT